MKRKGTLCRRGGQRAIAKADGDFLLRKLHRSINVCRVIDLALNYSLRPDSFCLYSNAEGLKGSALVDASNKILLRTGRPSEEKLIEP